MPKRQKGAKKHEKNEGVFVSAMKESQNGMKKVFQQFPQFTCTTGLTFVLQNCRRNMKNAEKSKKT
jgi:hypothetical protein